MYAPSARGLFHKAIMQSGGKPSFRDPEVTGKVGLALMEVLGLSNTEVDKLKDIPLMNCWQQGTRPLTRSWERLRGCAWAGLLCLT